MHPKEPFSKGILVASLARRTVVLAFCFGVLIAWPCLGQSEAGADSGPVVAASQAVVEALRAGAETGEVPADILQAAEKLWLDQQADLIRTQAELQILGLRSSDACAPIDEIVKVVANRERRAFARLEQLRELYSGLPPMAAQGEKKADEEGFMRLRLIIEPEDLTEDPTP